MTRGLLVVVGGHSRGVGKTSLIEHLLRIRAHEIWIAVKISAHRHAPADLQVPLIEEAPEPSSSTQTGRYLVAGARRAFLLRAPDAALPQAAGFIDRLRQGAANIVVESNRIVAHVRPDTLFFVVDPRVADWKASSALCLPVADQVVAGPPWVAADDAMNVASRFAANAVTAAISRTVEGGSSDHAEFFMLVRKNSRERSGAAVMRTARSRKRGRL